MVSVPEQEKCLLSNICATTSPDAPPCGFGELHLSPLLVSENLCPDAAEGQIYFERTSLVREVSARNFFVGSALVDFALSDEVGSSEGWEAMDEAEARFRAAATSEDTGPEEWFRSHLLLQYMGLFRKRLANTAILPDHITSVRKNIAEMRHTVRDCIPNWQERNSMSRRLALFQLILGSDVLFFPGLGREARTAYPINRRLNHGGYAFIPGEGAALPRKVPVTFTVCKRESDMLLPLYYDRLVSKVLERHPPASASEDHHSIAGQLLAWPHRAAAEHRLSQTSQEYLDAATAVIRETFKNHLSKHEPVGT